MTTLVQQLFIGLTEGSSARSADAPHADEDASERLEALLRNEVCTYHVETTLDGSDCLMCDLDEAQHLVSRPEWARPSGHTFLVSKEFIA